MKKQNSRGRSPEVAEMIRKARHPAERPLTVISVLITVAVLIFLAWNVTYSIRTPADESAAVSTLASFLEIDEESAALLLKAEAWIVLIVVLIIYFRYWFSLFNEKNRAASDDLTALDFISGEPKEIVDRYVKILEMKEPPSLYFSDTGTPVTVNDVDAYGDSYIVLSTDLPLEKETDERMINFRFTLASELGGICMGHNSLILQVLTLPGRGIPVLSGFYMKALAYGTDRLALEILLRDSSVSITREDVAHVLLLREYSLYTRPLIDVEKATENRKKEMDKMGRLQKAMLRIGSDKPVLMDRIKAILDESGKHGPLL